MRERQLKRTEGDRGADIDVADEVHLIDTAAALEAVAVEKEIAPDRAAIDAGENVRADIARRLIIAGARLARVDAQRAVVLRQIEAQPRHAADIDVIVDVAD